MLESVFIFSCCFLHCVSSFFYSFSLYNEFRWYEIKKNWRERWAKISEAFSCFLVDAFIFGFIVTRILFSLPLPSFFHPSHPLSLSLSRLHLIHWHLLFTNFYTQLMIFPFLFIFSTESNKRETEADNDDDDEEEKKEKQYLYLFVDVTSHFLCISDQHWSDLLDKIFPFIQTCHECLELLIEVFSFDSSFLHVSSSLIRKSVTNNSCWSVELKSKKNSVYLR